MGAVNCRGRHRRRWFLMIAVSTCGPCRRCRYHADLQTTAHYLHSDTRTKQEAVEAGRVVRRLPRESVGVGAPDKRGVSPKAAPPHDICSPPVPLSLARSKHRSQRFLARRSHEKSEGLRFSSLLVSVWVARLVGLSALNRCRMLRTDFATCVRRCLRIRFRFRSAVRISLSPCR